MCQAKYTEPYILDTSGGVDGGSSTVVPMVRGSNPGVVGSLFGYKKSHLELELLDIQRKHLGLAGEFDF